MSDRRAPRKAVPDMREKKQVTARMTEQFAEDLNLIFEHFGLSDVTYVLQQSVAAQADAIRDRMAGDRRALARSIKGT